jgi:hypothetical protein
MKASDSAVPVDHFDDFCQYSDAAVGLLAAAPPLVSRCFPALG